MQSFIWGKGTNVSSPEELKRRRELSAAVLAYNNRNQPKNLWEGLNSAATDIIGAVEGNRFDRQEAEGRVSAKKAYEPVYEALKNKQPVPNDVLMGALGNEWGNPGQRATAQALLGQNLETNAPLTKWQQAQAGFEQQRVGFEGRRVALSEAEANRPEFGYFESNGDRYRYNSRDPNAKPELFFDGPDAPLDPVKVGQGDTLLDPKTYQPIYQGQPRPTDDIAEYNFYVQQEKAAGRTPAPFNDYQVAVKKAGASNFNMGGGSDKQIFDALDASATSARGAVNGLSGIREAKKAIAGGAITGAYADQRLALQKVGALIGVADPAKIVNTETFRAQIAPQVAAVMKATVGSTQISNADREFAQQAAGGSINLDEKSIARLLDIMERAGTVILQGHTDRLNKVYPEGKGFDRERAIFGVDALPPEPSPPPNQRIRVDRNGRPL